jgi:hypothetical protein
LACTNIEATRRQSSPAARKIRLFAPKAIAASGLSRPPAIQASANQTHVAIRTAVVARGGWR